MKDRTILKSHTLKINMRCKRCNAPLEHEIWVPSSIAAVCSPNKKDKAAAKVAAAVINSSHKTQRIRCRCHAVECSYAPGDELDDPYEFAEMVDADQRPPFWPELTNDGEGLDN